MNTALQVRTDSANDRKECSPLRGNKSQQVNFQDHYLAVQSPTETQNKLTKEGEANFCHTVPCLGTYCMGGGGSVG